MYVKIRKSTLVVCSLLAVLAVIGLCAAVLTLDLLRDGQRDDYRNSVAVQWRQSVSELAGALSDLETDLQKGLYSSGSYQAISWAARVFSHAGAARTALESLPLYELQLRGTETFLNQVGEFTLELARKQLRGEEADKDEIQSLKTLALRAQELADEVLSMAEKISDENPDFDAMQQLLQPSEEGAEPTQFESLESIFEGDSPLIYDGVYSAWRQGRTSAWLQDLPEVSAERLLEIAGGYLSAEGVSEGVSYDQPISLREFVNGEDSVLLTGRGGYLCGLSLSREVGEGKLSLDEALHKGTDHLASFGYEDMEPISWSVSDSRVTAVYALRQDGALIYADRITVAVALDDGEILNLDATEYLLSHVPDRSVCYEVSADSARTVLRSDLKVLETDLAVLMGGDGSETLCWQFTVRGEDETKVLVFVNAKTSVEEEILILVEDDDRRTVV